MKINNVFFERLIRDSERIAILRRLSSNGAYLDKETIASICGEVSPAEETELVDDIPEVSENPYDSDAETAIEHTAMVLKEIAEGIK